MSMPFSVVREIPTIVQQDFAYAQRVWEQPITSDTSAAHLTERRDQSIRIALIVTRAVALVAAVYQFSKAISQGSGIRLSTALFVVFWHEIFVLANNTTKLLNERQQSSNGSSLVQTLRNLGRSVLDEMTIQEQTSNPLTDGTCFPAVWNYMINKITEERQQQPQEV
jgi:hypothetical protein